MTKITRIVSALALVFISNISIAANDTCSNMVPYGYPTVVNSSTQTFTQLCRIAYTVLHDNTRKVPVYSAELLLIENIPLKIKRVNAFKADPDLPYGSRAELSDYDYTYDRGHMTPFEDARKSSAAALQTFYMSNMVPQNLHLNRGMWRALENQTRVWAKRSSSGIFVLTGPIFNKQPIDTIGNGVAVPTHIFKVVIDRSTGQGIAFIIPNVDPIPGTSLHDYVVTIKQVEEASGLILTPDNRNGDLIDSTGSEFKLN